MFKCDLCNKHFAKEIQLKAHIHPTSCICRPFDGIKCQYCVENASSLKLVEVPCNGKCGFGPDVDCLVGHYEYVKNPAHQ